MITQIDRFTGQYRFLSNFFPLPVVFEGLTYPSVENAYQAAKTCVLGERWAFTHYTSAVAKRSGRRLDLRDDWETVRIEIMLTLLHAKFGMNPQREWLRATGDAVLVEGNDWGDRFWGVHQGVGENRLGQLLMQVRTELQARRYVPWDPRRVGKRKGER